MFRKVAVDKTRFAKIAHMQANISASSAEDSDIYIPAPQGLSYLPYQRAGIAFGLKNAGVLIADEPGLGKTIQAIGIINADPSMHRILLVVPASLKINWSRELKKWLVKSRTIEIIEGEPTDASADLRFESDVVIINYELVPLYAELINEYAWDMVIADECHILRNPEAQRTQSFVGNFENTIPPIKACRRVFLTGTPILNRARDVWALISYLNPRAWQSYDEFVKKFCQGGSKDSGSSNLSILQRLLRATVMIRRLKKDVLKELPPKRRRIVKLPCNSSHIQNLLEEERMLYQYADTSEEQWSRYAKTLAHFKETKKIALKDTSRIRHAIAVAKIPMMIEYIESQLVDNQKLIIFAHHQDVIDALVNYFGNIAVSFTGRSSATDKQFAVDEFQNNPNIRLSIISILSAGVGITLTAAHRAIFVELDWTAANITQAEDRCHRIGQTKTVDIIHLILDGSIDIHLAQKIIEKQLIYDEALN